MLHLFSNNAETTLDVAVDFDDTTLTVVDAGAFTSPSGGDVQLATLTHADSPGAYEVVQITEVSGLDFTVVREYEGAAQSWPVGTLVSARITAKTLQAFPQRDSATAVVQGQGDGPSGPGSFIFGAGAASYDVRYSDTLILAGRSRIVGGVQLSGWPTLQKLRSSAGVSGYDRNVAYESWGGTYHVDLGTAVDWATDNNYARGMVVSPTTPDGNQYTLDITSVEDSGSSSVGAEPTWNTSGATAVSNGNWYPVALPVDITSGTMRNVLITEVGFVCDIYSASSPPVVDIGTASAPTRFANGVTLSQITGDNCVHRIILSTGGAMVSGEALTFAVDTAAAGGRCMGRFYWRGLFIEAGENS